jgi:hypothetical protein
MRLHDCDAHLEWARLRRHVARARALVNETEYGAGSGVRWLEEALGRG